VSQSRGGGLRILMSSTGACRYGTSRASAPPSVEGNARLDAEVTTHFAQRVAPQQGASEPSSPHNLQAARAGVHAFSPSPRLVVGSTHSRARSKSMARTGRAVVAPLGRIRWRPV
jgi:hypothetical protein